MSLEQLCSALLCYALDMLRLLCPWTARSGMDTELAIKPRPGSQDLQGISYV